MTCSTCTGSTDTSNNVGDDLGASGGSQGGGVTYDDGQGVKGRVVLSGPMSEVLREQLNIIFKRTPLDTSNDPATLDLTQAVAIETIVQDEAVRNAFTKALNTPATSVILHNFDVVTIKEHVERMHENKPTSADLDSAKQINIVAATMDQILDAPTMASYDLSDQDEVVLVNVPDVSSTDGANKDTFVIKGPNRITQALCTPVPRTEAAHDYPTVTDKIEAMERIMPGRKVHVGVERFVLSLVSRSQAARNAQA